MEPTVIEVAIVEDEAETAEMLAEMMRVNGYDVRLYHGAQTAIFAFSHHPPHLVILDIMMPDMSGLEVLRYMRRDPLLQNVPVIILSAKSTPTAIREGLESGADRYLTKPVTFRKLTNTVKEVLAAQTNGTASRGFS